MLNTSVRMALYTRRPYLTGINRATGQVTNQMFGELIIYSSEGIPAWQFQDGGTLVSYGKANSQRAEQCPDVPADGRGRAIASYR